jgi:hypothetical protein
MRLSILPALILCLLSHIAFAQADTWLSFTIKAGVCHGEKPVNITVLARRSVLKQFVRKESIHFGTCSYNLESADQILSTATPADPPPGSNSNPDNIWVNDPGEFLELYKLEKANKVSGEICVDSEGKVTFTLGTEDARIGINTKGKFSISAASSEGQTHTVEF